MSTIAISEAYLHTNSDKEVIMIPKGILVEVLVHIYLSIYKKYVLL